MISSSTISARAPAATLDGRALPFEWDDERRQLVPALPPMHANTCTLRVDLAPAGDPL